MNLKQRQQIANLLVEKPEFSDRRNRYPAISEILQRHYGIVLEPKDIQLICSLADEYRHQTQADEIGLNLSEEWKSPSQRAYEEENRRHIKLI